ncbi:hypothetical protein DFH09DRAFT_1136116 [Mycena vulgaris]|nr:hypothetical protein DFH09DRAFT_1136116 [Mycena vulgaris]
MPEKGVVKLNEREVRWEERQVPKKISRDDDQAFYGRFITHPECCARLIGQRQTFSLHVCSPQDPNFLVLPGVLPDSSTSKTGKTKSPYYCKACHSARNDEDVEEITPSISASSPETVSATATNTPCAEYVNSLNIVGRLYAKARGKELLIAICNKSTAENFIFRIAFGLEAHCFWLPTRWYTTITSQTPVKRGAKSRAFPIPSEYILDSDAPSKEGHIISIQAAFIRPKWTLVFVDHNVLITFHLMQASPAFLPSHIEPGSTSKIWLALWSSTHGPVYSQEPDATLRALRDWRSRISKQSDGQQSFTPIFLSIKGTQSVFNGSGAQEATDILLLAMIYPQMPTYYVCREDETWARLERAVIDYDKNRMDLALPSSRLPSVSSPAPFHMNHDGHAKYLQHISTYRHSRVILPIEDLRRTHELGLFIPNARIQPNGHASVPLNSETTDIQTAQTPRARRGPA